MSKQQLIADALKKVGAEKNTGSTEAQIAILSDKITRLQEHLHINKKDKHSRRGLLQMVADRRKLVKYIRRTNPTLWSDVSKKIGVKE